MMKPNIPQGDSLADTISKAKTLEKLYKIFCQVFKNQNKTYYLFKEAYFNSWAALSLTPPPNPTICDGYTFITLPTSNSLEGGHPLLVPLNLIGLIEDNLEASYVKDKAGLFSLSFIYKLSRHSFQGFTSLYDAKVYFSNFKKLELIKYYLSLKTEYERNLLSPYISSDFNPLEEPSKATHTRVCNKSSWQYSAWKNLLASLRSQGYCPLGSSQELIKAQKLIHPALLSFNYFEPLIGYVRNLTLLSEAVLTYDFFGDCFITRDSLVYLPKKLILNQKQWLASGAFKPTKVPRGFCFRCRDAESKLVRSPIFQTEEEASIAHTQFKFQTLLDVYSHYKDKLPTNFCTRFEEEIVNACYGSC